MILRIDHLVEYQYDRAITLDPHTARLMPRCDGSQRVIEHELFIDPAPAGMTHALDVEGNAAARFWFTGSHELLRVRSVSCVQTTRDNPFDYLLKSSALRIPIQYDAMAHAALAPYRVRPMMYEYGADAVAGFAHQVLERSGRETGAFLLDLSMEISQRCRMVIRPHGDPMPAAQTLALGRGACRDIAVLFVDACRSVGLAARFVSGYFADPDPAGHHHLHAWAEVYLPQAGWRAFDPSYGLAVADRHVAIAASADSRRAAPLLGSFRGNGATAKMHTTIHVEPVEVTAAAAGSTGR